MAATGLVTLTVPRDYGYVLLAASSSFLVTSWIAGRTGSFRRAAGVPYPIQYAATNTAATSSLPPAEAAAADKAGYLFNCAQRAHGQYMENYPMMLTGLLIGGLRFPVLSAGLAASWLGFRVIYARGYTDPSQENGKGRLRGVWYFVPQFALFVLSFLSSWSLLTAGGEASPLAGRGFF